MTSPTPEGQEFAADWTGADSFPVQLFNQLLCQVGLPGGPSGMPEGVYLTFGRATPPIVYGDPDLVREQLTAYNGRLKIEPVARVLLSVDRLRETIAVLQEALGNLEKIEAQVKGVPHG